jgi:DNA-directed RNA polymerase specialized sigma24 family protein
MTGLATRTIQKTKTPTILQRIAEKDKTAVKDCIDIYGNFIWALARKLTASREEAEAATEEIFIDIWRYCERARNTQSIEKKLIAMIALRRLIKPLHQAKQISMANIDAPNEQGEGMDRISESF